MQTYLNGNVIPFMYLGTSNAGLTYDSSSRCLKIEHPTTFSSWKNQYLDAAKAALDADGYTTKLNFFDPYRSNYDEGMVLEATKAVAGGTISIHLDYSLCLVSYAAEYTLPKKTGFGLVMSLLLLTAPSVEIQSRTSISAMKSKSLLELIRLP